MTESLNVTSDTNRKPDKPRTSEPCISCKLLVEGEELTWAEEQQNHPGVLGIVHQKCYDKICEAEPDTPCWTDPISGEVDYEAMQEDLSVSTGEEWEDDDFF
jgi:hypothetical protein